MWITCTLWQVQWSIFCLTPLEIFLLTFRFDFLFSIQCDSKYPRCTACATAGTPCHQEDRHRQTLTLRGHTEYLEHRLAQCDALLKRRIPGFDTENLDEILVREGVEVDTDASFPFPISASFQFAAGPSAFFPPKVVSLLFFDSSRP
jgi:hypothetical protein